MTHDINAPHFIMPVREGEFFLPATEQYFQKFFDSNPKSKDGHEVVALSLQYLVHPESWERTRCHIWLRIISRRDDEKMFEGDLRDLDQSNRTAIQSAKDLLFQLSLDSLHEQMIIILPWQDPELERQMLGKEFILHKAKNFSILTPEHIPGWIDKTPEVLNGTRTPSDLRLATCQLLIPAVHSSHDAMERHKNLPAISALAAEIFAFSSEEEISVTVDTDNIEKI
jgi:hypothetical protein